MNTTFKFHKTSPLSSVAILKLIQRYLPCKFITGIYMVCGLLPEVLAKSHLAEAFVVSSNNDVCCISKTFVDLSLDNIYDDLNMRGHALEIIP